MGLAVFDICDTLYAVNTTVDFLRFFGERHDPALVRRIDRWTERRHAPWWIGTAVYRLGRIDLAKRRILAGLSGHERQRIEEEAAAYVAERLPTLANKPLMVRLEQHRSAGDVVRLLSSSIAPVAEAIGRSLRVPAHGSELEYLDERCTGRLVADLSGRKADWLTRRAAGIERPLAVYTDNQSDLPLILLADHATIVLPKGRTRQWAGSNCEYVRL